MAAEQAGNRAGIFCIPVWARQDITEVCSSSSSSSSQPFEEAAELTGVDAGAGGRDAELGLDEFRDEGDESGYYGAFSRVGEADEQEGDVAEDPHRSFGQI